MSDSEVRQAQQMALARERLHNMSTNHQAFSSAESGSNSLPTANVHGASNSQNAAIADYQLQFLLLEQQNRRRLIEARQAQERVGDDQKAMDDMATLSKRLLENGSLSLQGYQMQLMSLEQQRSERMLDARQENGLCQAQSSVHDQHGNDNHAFQDYQMQLMLLELQNKKRLLLARKEQEQHPKQQHVPTENAITAPAETMSEKGGPLSCSVIPSRPLTRPRRPVYRIVWRVFTLCAALSLYLHFRAGMLYRITPIEPLSPAEASGGFPEAPYFGWDDIPSLPELDYVPCYDKFYCARLELPRDYWNGTTDKTISLAVLKIPATVGIDHPDYKGPVLMNPGGPSGSGVELAFRAGETLQSVIQGAFPTGSKERFFDVVGFDPRGVGLTEPRVDCSGAVGRSESWRLRKMEEGILTSSDAALGRQWSMMLATSGRCADVDDENIQHYITTAYVARDMLELVEASARWRQKGLIKLGSDIVVNAEIEKIQYWGFSYGSYLGNTFAAMFPDRVGRLIVDGVVDAYDYVQGVWYDNLVDTEKDMDMFYDNCARVGYPRCRLADLEHPSPAQVRQRTATIIENTWHRPIAVTEPYAEIISWSDIRNFMFATLYSPVAGFEFLANVLYGLERGDASLLAGLLQFYHGFQCPSSDESVVKDALRNATFHFRPNDPFVQSAILCADADPHPFPSQDAFVSHINEMLELSPTIGDIWAGIPLNCIGYTLRAQHRFRGPWVGNTSHPLLMIGNTADPVTPLGAAKKMAAGFEGARVLTQDGPGHCSLAGYSPCTMQYVHEYFFDGTLPEEGTVCPVVTLPFGLSPGEVATAEVLAAGRAHGELGKVLMDVGGGFMMGSGTGKIDVRKML